MFVCVCFFVCLVACFCFLCLFVCFILYYFWFVFVCLFTRPSVSSFVRSLLCFFAFTFVATWYYKWGTSRTKKVTLVILSFTVTEKVWESESTDASDDDLQIANDPPVNEKRPSPAKKTNKKSYTDAKSKSTKQASLTSFFKKSWKKLTVN